MKEASLHRITEVVWALTSRSSRHRRDAGRYTADRRCPSSCRPVSSSSPQRHRALNPQTLLGKRHIFYCIQIKPKCWEHLASPLESKLHTMGAAELAPTQRRNPEAASTKWTTESSIFIWSTSLLLSYLYIRRLLWRRSEVGSAPSCNSKVWPKMTSIRERFGGDLWVVNRRESCILELFRALWRTPRCAPAGMNLLW